MTYLPTQEDLALLDSHSKSLFTRVELLNKESQIIDSIEGLTLDGSGSIDADSDIRRTYSLSIFPKKNFSISKFNSEDWVDKKVRIYVGMKTPTSEKDVGSFIYNGGEEKESVRTILLNNKAYISKNKELQTYIASIKATERDTYGNIDNVNRPRIIWDSQTLSTYRAFVNENGPFEIGDYSTVCGCDDVWTAYNDAVGVTVTRRIAYTLFLENNGKLIPIDRDGVMSYISEIYKLAYNKVYNSNSLNPLEWIEEAVGTASGILNGLLGFDTWTSIDIRFSDAVLSFDKIGLTCEINGKSVYLKNMISAIEGIYIENRPITSADVAAIAGWSKKDIKKEFNAESQFIGYSMHDIQSHIWELKDGIEQIRKYIVQSLAVDNAVRNCANYVDEDGIHWFSAGVYAIQSNGITYDSKTNQLNLSCVDLVSMLDGTLGGTLTGYSTRIPMYKLIEGKDENGDKIYTADKTKPYYIRDVIKTTFELSGMKKSIVDYWKRRIPHDLEYNTGTTIWTILTELRDLYYPFEMYFDDDTFVCKEIPNGYDDPVVIDEDVFKNLVISEDASVDYTQIHNCVESWGSTITSDYFCKEKLEDNNPNGTGIVEYKYRPAWMTDNIWDSVINSALGVAGTIIEGVMWVSSNLDLKNYGHANIILKMKNASISEGTRISFVCPEDIRQDARVYIQNDIIRTVTDQESGAQSKETTRQLYGPMMVYEASTDKNGNDVPLDTSILKKGRYYVFQYGEKYIDQSDEGSYKWVFNSTTGGYDKVELNPKIQYISKEEYNEETKQYETNWYKVTNTPDGKEIEKLEDPALIKESRVYFLGQSQSHAMVKFVDKMPSSSEIEKDKSIEGCDNLEYVVVKDPKDLTNLYNSRFTIDKIGRRNLVCSGGEFDSYVNDETLMVATQYQLWKNCRLTDTVTLKMHLIPWLDVNQKVKYAAKYLKSDVPVEWIIKKISTNLGEGVMSVTLSRYFPYYPYITYKNVAKSKYVEPTT